MGPHPVRVAVCLLTCGRPDETALAVSSFQKHNPVPKGLVLLQADEPAVGPQAGQIGAAAGFRIVHAPTARSGWMTALRALVAASAQAQADWMLWLENDWETLAPLPWSKLSAGVEQVRLFGAWKRPGNPAGPHQIGTKILLVWMPHGKDWQRGRAHWGCGGTLIRTALLASLADLPTHKAVMMARPDLDTLRPVGNIMRSMGAPTTAGFMG